MLHLRDVKDAVKAPEPGQEYRAMIGGRWYRVLYLRPDGVACGKPMHKFQWITGPRAGTRQSGWGMFRSLPGAKAK